MDAGLDENEAEFGVLVLAVALEVLAHGDGLVVFVSKFECRGGGECMQTFLMSM